ncbi:hypothetical protein PPERSA_09061 [Pseudocohnilembus persalinus]|uniref:Peptidase C1A papain C-terminal domain-containing protein n=1 Tax=Pseudocohnilembus persalinus TaxID=266149 RepID=A0A0V0QKZ3_PSEPJ|nr:hypothetical protein PPERSA_09061 [Pseudocohnilembus persalinus]|eukprot:KRX02939.1 hypothetical protein PPERSA_09061 [Pseudocohnilembus persalinus]
MQGQLLTLFALAATTLLLLGGSGDFSNLRNTEVVKATAEFAQWKLTNGVNFAASEEAYRFEIFFENLKLVQKLNAEQTGSLRLGMTPFAAMTTEEFAETRTTKLTQSNSSIQYPSKPAQGVKEVPKSIDWVAKGAVAPVEDQGHCGSCWAFSTKESIEGFHYLESGEMVVLSAQQLVDCSLMNLGCSGGDPMTAYQYVQKNGIMSEESYPYISGTTGKRSTCQYDKSKVVVQNSSQTRVSPQNDAQAIREAATLGPLTIEVAAGNIFFQFYTSGVIDSTSCPTALDHGVLLTGYNDSASTPYWTIKNSWGPAWGNKGYANIAIQETGKGICGLQQYVAYPNL